MKYVAYTLLVVYVIILVEASTGWRQECQIGKPLDQVTEGE